MIKHQSILVYLLTFLALSILLKIFGIIDFSGSEILGYAFIFYGVSIVFLSFGKNKGIRLFLGSTVFLIGIVLFIINNFDFIQPIELFFPSLLFITGLSLLIVFFDNASNITLLIISAAFILSGTIYTFFFGSLNGALFLQSIWNIILKYWPVLIIVAGIFFLIGRD